MEIQPHLEHLKCFYHEPKNQPTISVKYVAAEECWKFTTTENVILFFLEGHPIVKFQYYDEEVLSKGHVLFIPSGHKISCLSQESSMYLLIRLHEQVKFCECFILEQLYKEYQNELHNQEAVLSPHYLEVYGILWHYLNGIIRSIEDGLCCKYYFETKIKELFYLLRAYYPKRELRDFFRLILTNDTVFSDYVKNNHLNYKTAFDLAESMNYSYSGFLKKFKSVFGMPAYRWMKEQKAELIYRELIAGDKNFKELSFEYGFSSNTQFNDFCKLQLGKTPGEIRKIRVDGMENEDVIPEE